MALGEMGTPATDKVSTTDPVASRVLSWNGPDTCARVRAYALVRSEDTHTQYVRGK